ncbi:MAG: DUF2244 domain-containing protein [Silicimonas sp.]|nr:DUF2244 domain-containing protein [Silicimonas sp.]
MPYEWSTDTHPTKSLMLWPHQSMTRAGFSWFIGITAVMLLLPLLAVLGSPVVWVLLVFFVATLAGVWRAVMVNKAHRTMHEALTVTPKKVRLSHVPHKGEPKDWEANPFWVKVNLRRDGPVENYLTLQGNGREVEIGAFLTPEERAALYDELRSALTCD